MRGGYKILDFKGIALSDDSSNPTIIDGIYEDIEGSLKPFYAHGLNIAGVEYKDQFIVPTISTNITFTVGSHTVTITADDEVYYA